MQHSAEMKNVAARAIFREHLYVKKQLWGDEFSEDGYFARIVGDKVTADVIKNVFSIIALKDNPHLNLF